MNTSPARRPSTTWRDPIEQARAYGALYEGHLTSRGAETPSSERLKQRAGIALFGNDRLAALVRCMTCGCLGEPGDECGRRPHGHRLNERGDQ